MDYEKMWKTLKADLGHKKIYAMIAEKSGRYDLYTLLKDEMNVIESVNNLTNGVTDQQV